MFCSAAKESDFSTVPSALPGGIIAPQSLNTDIIVITSCVLYPKLCEGAADLPHRNYISLNGCMTFCLRQRLFVRAHDCTASRELMPENAQSLYHRFN